MKKRDIFHIRTYYSLATVLLAYLTWEVDNPFIRLALAWFLLSMTAVTLAYWLNKPGIFRKRSDGTIPAYIRWLFIPFLTGAQLYNAYARKHDRVPAIQQIDEHLFLACRLFPSDIEMLRAEGVDAILDVTSEFDGLDWSAQEQDWDYLNIPVLDHNRANTRQLNQGINWIHHHVSQGRGVVVHCALGRGRSVMMLMAYLLASGRGKTVDQVMASIKSIRSTARLNPTQSRGLNKAFNRGALRLIRKAWIIANPISGGGKWQEHQAEILSLLDPYFDLEVHCTSKQTGAGELAAKAVDAGVDCIIACGGDGTVSAVAARVINTPIKLGIIPMGTTNAFAHVIFGLDSKFTPVDVACDALISGDAIVTDTASCNGQVVMLLVGVGFALIMIEAADRDEKNALGQLAYIRGLLRAVDQNTHLHCMLRIDDESPIEVVTTSLVVANAAPMTTLVAQGRGQPDLADGKLDITWLKNTDSPIEGIMSLAELSLAGLTNSAAKQYIEHRQCQRIRIHCKPESKYVIDGELCEPADLDIQVQPRSLHILVPQEFSEEIRIKKCQKAMAG